MIVSCIVAIIREENPLHFQSEIQKIQVLGDSCRKKQYSLYCSGSRTTSGKIIVECSGAEEGRSCRTIQVQADSLA